MDRVYGEIYGIARTHYQTPYVPIVHKRSLMYTLDVMFQLARVS